MVVRAVLVVSKEVTTKEFLMVLIALSATQDDVHLPGSLLSALKETRYASHSGTWISLGSHIGTLSDLIHVIPDTLAWRNADKFYAALIQLILR